ncbi:hypothetical protein TNCV_615651 [Trichonephila clavipes]|nr:hypothetical protein TNCV_615651 [Trichonephila clavipes]
MGHFKRSGGPEVEYRCLERSAATMVPTEIGFNGPYGRQGCVLARTVESNQGGRFDGNESVADSFRSGAVSFKTHVQAISRGFFPSYVCQKNLPV